jgi:hypothetical protein
MSAAASNKQQQHHHNEPIEAGAGAVATKGNYRYNYCVIALSIEFTAGIILHVYILNFYFFVAQSCSCRSRCVPECSS